MQNFSAPNSNPYGYNPQQPQPPKKSKTPWIIAGVVGCLGLIVLILAGVGGIAYFASKQANNFNTSSSTTTTTAEPSAPAANTRRFVNSRSGLTGKLSENYVDFSFDYPDTWKLDPDPAPSFVRVEHNNEDGNTIENFSVGWFQATGNVSGNRALLSNLVNQLGAQVAGNFPGYTKVSEDFTTLGSYDGYELKYAGVARAPGGDVPYWGRIVLLPNKAGNKGVSIIMLATSHGDEVEGLDDVGVKGDLPVMIESFRLEK